MKQYTKFKRVLSGFLSVVMVLSTIPIASVNAVESNSASFNYDGYAVSYNVTDSWDNTEIVSVTITNTSEAPIENWMLYFDPHGNITNIWDAQTAVTSTNVTYFKNAGYNSTIEPETSVTFSYFIDGCVSIPDSYTLCQKRVEKASDGYSVEVVVDDSWDDVFNGTIILTNETDKPIEDWELTFDTNFTITEITSSWAGTMTALEPYTYMLKGSYTNVIEPHSSVNLGFSGIKNGTPEIIDSSLTEIVADEALINFKFEYPNGVGIYAFGEYNDADNAIEIDWYSNYKTDIYDILASNDGENYTLVSSVSNTTSYTYPITEEFDEIFLKVGLTTDLEEYFESTPFIVAKTDEGYKVNYPDTDGDGLPDVYEVSKYNTDPHNPDTDGDCIPDGYEVITLHTDPTLTDTDNNGITDDIEDFDSDNLNNYEEYINGTNPIVADTDEDNLFDGDEVKIYGTDPLNPDTDNDGILDIDEINFNLNPNDPSDADTPIPQILNKEDMLANRYNTEFSITMDVEASNSVKRFLKQELSRYSGVLSDNRAIIGRPINLEYNAGTIYSGTIKFELKDELVTETPEYYPDLNLGIERYGVFIYDKEVGTIVPVSCEYNTDDNSLTIDATIMGNLMIIDYEALLYDLGFTPDEVFEALNLDNSDENEYDKSGESDIETISDVDIKLFSQELAMNNPTVLSSSPESISYGPRQIELVLVIDTTSSMSGQISAIKNNLNNLITKLYNAGITQYTTVITFGDITNNEKTLLNNYDPQSYGNYNPFNNNPTTIQSIINNIKMCSGGDALETPIDGLGLANSLNYSDSRSKYLFLITDIGYKTNNNYGYTNMKGVADDLYEKGIYASIITENDKFSAYKDLTSTTGGIEISQNGNFCDDMYDFITRNTPRVSVIVANNLVTGCFKENLVKGGSCDTDEDGKTDSDEVNWKYIDINKDGSYTYPTWEKLCKKSAYKSGKDNKLYEIMKGINVIPALSNPFSKDTDGDYYLDGVDDNPLEKDDMYINDAALDDEDFHRGNTITEKPSKKITDGDFVADDTVQTAKYSFKRSSNTDHFFTLTPKRDSFYKLCNYATNFGYIDVTHEKGVALWKETVYDLPDSDGLYFLRKGVEYRINVYGYNKGDYEFTVEQDNWEEVKYGATRKCNIDYFIVNQQYDSLYLTSEGLFKIIEQTELKKYGYTFTQEQLDDIIKNSDGTKSDTDIFYTDCSKWVNQINDSQNKGNEIFDNIATNVGNLLSFTGVALLISTAPEWVGIAVTIGGGATALYSETSFLLGYKTSMQKAAFIDAMYNGKGNICITNYTSDAIKSEEEMDHG